MSSSIVYLFIVILIKETVAISLNNVYTSYINKQNIDQSDTFGFHVQKPIGYKGDEPIWPRSYGYSAEMFFDENGAAFPVHQRRKIGSIIRPLREGVQSYDDDVSDYKKKLRDIYRRFRSS